MRRLKPETGNLRRAEEFKGAVPVQGELCRVRCEVARDRIPEKADAPFGCHREARLGAVAIHGVECAPRASTHPGASRHPSQEGTPD